LRRILLLSPCPLLEEFFISKSEGVLRHEGKDIPAGDFWLLVSYRYKYIIPPQVLADFHPKFRLNLHISYLPWNKGADPNLWSFIDNTLKGVTIHSLDNGLDTGDIAFQKRMFFSPNDTLATMFLLKEFGKSLDTNL